MLRLEGVTGNGNHTVMCAPPFSTSCKHRVCPVDGFGLEKKVRGYKQESSIETTTGFFTAPPVRVQVRFVPIHLCCRRLSKERLGSVGLIYLATKADILGWKQNGLWALQPAR